MQRNLQQEINETEERDWLMMKKHHQFSLFSHSYCALPSETEQQDDNTSSVVENQDLDDVDILTLKDQGKPCAEKGIRGPEEGTCQIQMERCEDSRR